MVSNITYLRSLIVVGTVSGMLTASIAYLSADPTVEPLRDEPELTEIGRTERAEPISLAYCLFLRTIADELLLFPEWEANDFDEPPAPVGPYNVAQRLVSFRFGIDGCPLEITVFEPLELSGPKPAFVWVQGSNVQPYYHQSLHETLASWGYVVIVPDTRPLTYLPDPYYHARNTGNAVLAIEWASRGDLGVPIDPDRIAAGGYSVGGTMATFVAAVNDRVQGTVTWAPTGSPFWLGVDADALWPQISSPTYLLLGELDPIAPPEGFPSDLVAALVSSESTTQVIDGGTHLYFQQPTGADSPSDPQTDLTRFEQQGIAIEATRVWLEQLLAPVASSW